MKGYMNLTFEEIDPESSGKQENCSIEIDMKVKNMNIIDKIEVIKAVMAGLQVTEFEKMIIFSQVVDVDYFKQEEDSYAN